MKTFLFVIFTTLALAALTGCNTVRGVGEDVSTVGHSIQRASR